MVATINKTKLKVNPTTTKGRIPNRARRAGTMWMHYCMPRQNKEITNTKDLERS
jgi:hypothetical protein